MSGERLSIRFPIAPVQPARPSVTRGQRLKMHNEQRRAVGLPIRRKRKPAKKMHRTVKRSPAVAAGVGGTWGLSGNVRILPEVLK